NTFAKDTIAVDSILDIQGLPAGHAPNSLRVSYAQVIDRSRWPVLEICCRALGALPVQMRRNELQQARAQHQTQRRTDVPSVTDPGVAMTRHPSRHRRHPQLAHGVRGVHGTRRRAVLALAVALCAGSLSAFAAAAPASATTTPTVTNPGFE